MLSLKTVVGRAWNPPPDNVSVRDDVLPAARAPRRSLLAALSKLDTVYRLAPRAILEGGEHAPPMDPLEFIRVSSLCKHRGLHKTVLRYNKVKKRWVAKKHPDLDADPEYFDPPLTVVNQYIIPRGRSDLSPCVNKTAEVKEEHPDGGLYLEAQPGKDHRLNGPAEPTGRTPAFYYILSRSRKCISKHDADFGIQYWFFYGRNPFKHNYHQGDWENITILVKDDHPIGALFHRHGKKGSRDQGAHQTRENRKIDVDSDGRYIVRIALGSHASYGKKGWKDKEQNRIKSHGAHWRTWERLQPVTGQPWKDYAGLWGSIKAGRGGLELVPCTAGGTGVLGPLIRTRKGRC